jgi:hypothetical protein
MAMGAAGACEGLLEALELHSRNTEAVFLCVKALFHLCDGNKDNMMKILVSGASDILLTIYSKFSDQERILDYLFSILVGMSHVPSRLGQNKLGNSVVAKAIISTLYRFEKSSEYLTLLSCALMHSLAIDSSDVQKRMAAAGACKAVVSALTRYARSTTFDSANKIISSSSKNGNITLIRDKDKDRMSPGGDVLGGSEAKKGDDDDDRSSSTPAVGLSLLNILGECSVLKESSKVIHAMSVGSDENISKFQASAALDILSDAVSNPGSISDETLFWVKRAIDVLI